MLSAVNGANRPGAVRYIAAGAAIAALAAADQAVKALVKAKLPFQQPVPVIKGLLNWTYTTNTGGGFSILSGRTLFLIIFTVCLMAALAFMYIRGFFSHWLGRLSCVLILAGGIGNLIDRVFNQGRVIDYIDISPLFDFAIFNLADCRVTVGGTLLCVYVLFFHDKHDKEDDSPKEKETE